MPDLVSLKRIEDTASALYAAGVFTLADLRMYLARDVDTGIQILAARTGASQALLLALLVAEAADKSVAKDTRKLSVYWRSLKTFAAVWALSTNEIKTLWRAGNPGYERKIGKQLWAVLRQSIVRPRRLLTSRRRHWLDVVVLVGIPLIAGLLLLQARYQRGAEYVVVKQGISLAAYQPITNQIELKSVPGGQGAFTSMDQVENHYTLVAVPAGSVLENNQILNTLLSQKMPVRKILSVRIQPGNYSSTLAPPSEATMVLSARHPELNAAPVSFEVIVLSLEGNGDFRSAVVALPEDKFKIAAALLGSHEVFLSQTAP